MKSIWIAVWGMAMMVLAVACSDNATGAGPDGSTPPAGDGGTGGNGAGITCTAIVNCITQCADSDTECPDACAAKGTPDAQTAVTALATCLDKNACKDETCLKTNCGPEADACFSPAAADTPPPPPGGTPTQGSIAQDIQGEWASYGEFWAFTADGTFAHIIKLESGTSWSESGIAVTSGDSIRIISKSEPEKDYTYTIQSGSTTSTGTDILTLASSTSTDSFDRTK
jgi:hypothetical protein